MHILVIDNYDSFTYNLVHYLEDLDCLVTVKRNDQLTIEEVADYDKIVLSPARIPDEAGLLKSIILLRPNQTHFRGLFGASGDW